MLLRQRFLTANECYKVGRSIVPKGIIVHSTGALNPDLKRYVGPDDGFLGFNKYNNHWNQLRPEGGRQICCHAFIGKLADGRVAAYQTLPWTMEGWHCGGQANKTHIGFEICEDNNAVYFRGAFREAAELCNYLCKMYGLGAKDILDHAEAHRKGLASNHGDVAHWFPKYGSSMDHLRAEVQGLLEAGEMYRVRKTWADAAGQAGAFRVYANAVVCANQNPGYSVFNQAGAAVYPGKAAA